MGDCYIVRRAGEAKKLPVLNASYPANVTNWQGEQATFRVEIATAGVPAEYTYQWYRDGAKWTGATNATVSWSSASVGSHSIYCVVTNKAGEVTSRVATLTVKNPNMAYTYSGSHEKIDDGSGNWRIKIKSSGTLKFTNLGKWNGVIDLFLVGGGGGTYEEGTRGASGGGGGGYTKTKKSITVVEGTNYQIVVGAGGQAGADGGSSSGFGQSVSGGQGRSNNSNGGNGGSGGATYFAGSGGSDGGNGGGSGATPGTGQGTTTREFGESTGTLYSGGGACAIVNNANDAGGAGGGGNAQQNGTANTGGGAGGSNENSHNGGSGIVVVRNHR